MIVTNIMFTLPNRSLFLWRASSNKDDKVVRNQIEYILINERYRNSIKSVKAWPGADTSSDHNPLTARIKLKIKKLSKLNPIHRIRGNY